MLWQWFQVLGKVFPVHWCILKVITINSKLLRTPVSEIIDIFQLAQNTFLGCGSLPNLMHLSLNFASSDTLLDCCRDYNTFCRYMLFCFYPLYHCPVQLSIHISAWLRDILISPIKSQLKPIPCNSIYSSEGKWSWLNHNILYFIFAWGIFWL
jgi:hypothetical protein